MKQLFLCSFSAFMTLAFTSVAGSNIRKLDKLSKCSQSQFDSIKQNQQKLEISSGLEGLSGALLVAKKASYAVSKASGTAISEIDFVTKKQKILCGQAKPNLESASVLTAPALIDLRQPSRISPSFWQFQLIMAGGDLGTWGTSTKIANSNIKKLISDQNLSVRVFQVDHDEVEVHYYKPSEETLVISYDLIESKSDN